MAPRARSPRVPSSSRARILAAASAEFAARGFDGAGVDRIARQAVVNKAMIYYHFASKAALYREVLRDMFCAAGERVRAIASREIPRAAKVREFVAALAAEAERRPHFPPIMLRELAEQGRHLDPETLRLMHVMPATLRSILRAPAGGREAGVPDPFLTYCSLLGPVMFFFASAPVRTRITRLGLAQVDGPPLADFVAYMQRTAMRLMAEGSGAARPLRRARSSRRRHAQRPRP